MLYPNKKIYICRFCKQKFDFSAGFNSPRLIEHLVAEHNDITLHNFGDLYLSDLIKKCYVSRRRSI